MGKNENTFADVMDACRHYVEAGALTVKDLARWCGRDDRTVYNWLGGQSGPSSKEVNLWLQRMPAKIRMHVAVAQLAGSGLLVSTSAEDEELGSLLTEAVEAVQSSTNLLGLVHDLHQDGDYTPDKREQIRSAALAARSEADDVVAATNSPRMKIG